MARPFLAAAVARIGVAVLFAATPIHAQEATVKAPPAAAIEPAHAGPEIAIFAGGCFWGVEGVFSHVRGVVSVTAGYAGGAAATAHYDEVATGETGHAESVKVTFDPRRVNYADLLRIYFSVVADPTLVNRQGPDHGTQYRTALFPLTPSQAAVARAYIAQLTNAHVFPRPIATRLERQRGFYPAEAVHQDFMARNPDYPYIVINDRPKVEALERLFPQVYKT